MLYARAFYVRDAYSPPLTTIPSKLVSSLIKVDSIFKRLREFMQKVHTNEIKIKARDWPTFLYDLNVQYDPRNKDVGLLCGPVFLRVRV